jgi:hypothetical protein
MAAKFPENRVVFELGIDQRIGAGIEPAPPFFHVIHGDPVLGATGLRGFNARTDFGGHACLQAGIVPLPRSGKPGNLTHH